MFLWIEDIECETPRISVLHFAQVVFGVASSPFLLNATIRHHIQGYYQADDLSFVAKFLNSIYVDDLTFRADSVDDAFELYTRSKHRLAKAGFNLRNFSSNSTDLLERIRQKKQHQAVVSPVHTSRGSIVCKAYTWCQSIPTPRWTKSSWSALGFGQAPTSSSSTSVIWARMQTWKRRRETLLA